MALFNQYKRWDYDILYPKRGGGWRVIKAGKWYINQNTPCGDPAELWERKAYDGRKRLDINKYMAIRDGGIKCECGMEYKPEYNDTCPRCGAEPASQSELIETLGCERRTQVDLLKFCHSSSEYNIHKPFSRGKWTYATDGKIAIRVPRIEGYDQDKGPKNIEQMFSDAEKRGAAVWQELPEFKLVVKECSWCGGRGYIKHCPAFGNPNIKCGNGDWKKCNRYNDDCAVGCTPSDKGAAMCTECFGSGTKKVNDGPVMIGAVGKTKVNSIYLDMICDLPKVQIAPHDGTSFFRITFDGGEGLLMPMRMELTELF